SPSAFPCTFIRPFPPLCRPTSAPPSFPPRRSSDLWRTAAHPAADDPAPAQGSAAVLPVHLPVGDRIPRLHGGPDALLHLPVLHRVGHVHPAALDRPGELHDAAVRRSGVPESHVQHLLLLPDLGAAGYGRLAVPRESA